MRRILHNVPLLVASAILALGLCEIVLRAVGFSERIQTVTNPVWPWVVYDPIVGRQNRPGYVLEDLGGVHIDSLGLRGDEIPRHKPAGTLRVVCLGDSATFGIWLDGSFAFLGTSYPAELQKRLAERGFGHVQVVNAGVLGYTTSEGLVQLLARVLPLEPDVLTVRFGNNDHATLWNAERPPLATGAEFRLLQVLPTWVYGTELGRLAFHAYRRALAGWWPIYGARRVPPLAFDRNLRRFVDIARAHGIRLLFIDFPYRELLRGDSPGETFPNFFTTARSLTELHAIHDEYQSIVDHVARETNVPFVTTLDELRLSPVPTFTDYDVSHPNAVGYRIIAERLFEELSARRWLEPPTP